METKKGSKYVRCAISALFEFDLWEEPGKAEELFVTHYGKLGLPINEPEIWALDSFRSIDPVYIHDYVIGATLAQPLINYLTQLYSIDYSSWGSWLQHNIYQDGWKRSFHEKLGFLIDL